MRGRRTSSQPTPSSCVSVPPVARSRARSSSSSSPLPGVPDLYQGDELEDLSLVDPDNRRPVDWDARHGALAALRDGAAPDASTSKLHVIRTTLRLRAEHPAAFEGAYEPIDLGADVCGYVRGGEVLVGAAIRPGAGIDLPNGWSELLGVPGLVLAVR